jgi:acyl-CoA thioesterase FadM
MQHGLVAAEGYSTVVSYNFKTAKAADFPPSMREAIDNLLKKDSLYLLETL